MLLPLLIVAGILLWSWKTSESDDRSDKLAKSSDDTAVPEVQSDTKQFQSESLVDQSRSISDRLRGEWEHLRKIKGEAAALNRILDMQASLLSVPPEEASRGIVSFLETGEDALTFGRFAPGSDGFLKSFPTYRTALLDILEKVDPDAALLVSKDILNTSENPDEWALSLRILSRHARNEEDQHVLANSIDALLSKNAWLDDPTFSYLHAFDAVVALGSPETIARLGELAAGGPNKAVSHAATLSIDRFFQLHSEVAVSYLEQHDEFLKSESGFRATLMARAHPGSESDMQAVEQYLERPAVDSSEKEAFFQLFPNFNSTFSYNLITGSLLLPRDEMRQRSEAALQRLESWLDDNRYPELEDDINQAINRLVKTWKVEL